MAIAAMDDLGRSIRPDCDTGYFLLNQIRSFNRHLESVRVRHEQRECPGGHDWARRVRPIREAITFHARNVHPECPAG